MWAKATGFEIVFALNNALRTRSGTWDTNSTLDILSVAEKAGISDIFWQLGYECSNQSIDDYLNDLETLRVVLETFPARGWRVSGADVTGCLRPGSRSDFKDYVTLALDSCDAVLLNGNSSSHELERLSPSDRLRLLKLLHASSTPLWLTEKPQGSAELPRAADWLAGLGYSARNGFAVHYRELSEEELYRPTLLEVLERLSIFSTLDRLRLLKLLHASSTPLWLTEKPQGSAELQRAADWMAGLGYSARNGFAVHYRELSEEELYRPTLLSTYDCMRLLKLLHASSTPLWLTEKPQGSAELPRAADWMAGLGYSARNGFAVHYRELSEEELYRPTLLLHASSTQLWLTEKPQGSAELPRAADWMAGLGYSARNGFAVHYRELSEEELYRPTLSFYMALLYKNLVGERVLSVELESSQALLFAHCTALRRQPVPGAVTLYGVNMDEEPARLSLKLSQREDGGDILQFILSQDEEGNIIVNGRIMSQEGDIRPVVKRVRPYKTLLINLPAKSIGFWVLANTKIEACRDFQDGAGKLVEAVSVEVDVNKDVEKDTDSKNTRRKRSPEDENLDDIDEMRSDNKEWNDRVDDLNDYLKEVHNIFKSKSVSKTKRQAYEDNQTTTKLKRQLLKTRQQFKLNDEERRPVLNLIDNLLKIRRNGTKFINKIGHGLMLHRSRIGSKNYKNTENGLEPQKRKLSRSRRSVSDKYEDVYSQEVVKDNEIDIKDKETRKLWKVLHSIQSQLKKMTEDISEKSQDTGKEDDSDPKAEQDKLVVKTEISEDSASIKFSEKPNHGILKEAFGKLFSAITELNTNLNRFWEAFDFFE
ncbi:uncharacterized protein LOC135083675 [Ostrinia nubilalis]|uniref:uncharacterized protein LOC135083675 n=1 Tax=Ostrinia nubilalis TaxID=29057 RepID=UPI0030823174